MSRGMWGIILLFVGINLWVVSFAITLNWFDFQTSALLGIMLSGLITLKLAGFRNLQ